MVVAEVNRDLQHIPRGDINQNVLRSAYRARRQSDLASDPSIAPHDSLQAAILAVTLSAKQFQPLYEATYFAPAAAKRNTEAA